MVFLKGLSGNKMICIDTKLNVKKKIYICFDKVVIYEQNFLFSSKDQKRLKDFNFSFNNLKMTEEIQGK